MLIQLIRFEWAFHRRQIAWRAATLIFFVLGLLMARGTLGGPAVLQDAPRTLSFFVGLLALGSYIAISLLAGAAVLRDQEHHMDELVHTTGLTHSAYLISRFVGLVTAALACLAAGVLGLYLGRFLPGLDPSRFGSPSPVPYLRALLVFGVPGVMLGCAVIFAAAALTRSTLATYLSGVALYVVYWVGSVLGNSPLMAQSRSLSSTDPYLGALLEPAGLVALIEQSRYWSAPELSTRTPSLSGVLLHNRLLWLAVGLMVFALAYRWFSFRPSTARSRNAAPVVKSPGSHHLYLPITPAPARRSSWLMAWSQARMGAGSMMRSLPFLGLLVLWVPFCLINLTDSLRRGDLGVRLQAVTEILLPALIEPLNLFGALVVCFFAAELAWRERDVRIDEIVDATPVSQAALQLGRVLALGVVVGILVGLSIALGVVVQLFAGVEPNLPLYLTLFARCGGPLVAVGVLALGVQALVPNKYLGLAVSLVLVLATTGLVVPGSLVVDHTLLRFATVPGYVGSAMAGSYSDGALVPYLGYWAGWCVLLLAASVHFGRAGRRRSRLARVWVPVVVVATLLAVGSAAWIARETAAAGGSLRDAELDDWRETYERRYGAQGPEPAPAIVAVTLAMDLHPAERTTKLAATLELENLGTAAVSKVEAFVDRRLRDRRLALAGAELASVDEEFGYYLFELHHPLEPGQRLSLEFSASLTTSAYSRIDPEAYLLPAASYVEVNKLLPSLEFRTDWTIASANRRRQRGLPPPATFPAATPQPDRADHITFDAVFSTTPGQTVVAPGTLVAAWDEGDRSFYHYNAPQPIPMGLGVASARYLQRQVELNGVTVVAYHHAGHEQQLDQGVLAGAAAALEYGAQRFAPYPARTLKVAEIPAFSERFGATANPDTIFAVESRLFLLEPGPRADDLAFRMLAHEVAHQWWGQQLDPAVVAGYRMLTEWLAVFTELVVAEHQFGPAATRQYLDMTADHYFSLRGDGAGAEQPLVAAADQAYVYYFKGAQVANVLRLLLGEEVVAEVLRGFLQERGYPHRPLAQELADRLEAAAPGGDQRAAVRELLTQVVTYDLTLHQASVEEAGVLGRRVSARLEAERNESDRDGRQVQTKQDFWLEVGFMRGEEVFEIERVWVAESPHTFELSTTSEADSLVLDPRGLLLVTPGSKQHVPLEAVP